MARTKKQLKAKKDKAAAEKAGKVGKAEEVENEEVENDAGGDDAAPEEPPKDSRGKRSAEESGDEQASPRKKAREDPEPEPKKVEEEEDDDADQGPMPPPAAPEADDDDDVGPMPAPAPKKKRQRVLPHEHLYLQNLPSCDMYEQSLMHRDVINFVEVAARTDFLITTSVDGHVKFWKKSERGIEFVKHYRAHLGPIVAVATSHDGTMFATAGADKALKVFDVVNFVPPTQPISSSDLESPKIHFYDGRDNSKTENGLNPDEPFATAAEIHSAPVHIMRYHALAETIVSVDTGGMMEYWTPDWEGGFPQPERPKIKWSFKSETDLYEFKKSKTVPTSLNLSPDLSKFVTFGFDDRQVRVFNFYTGKLLRKYDESLTVMTEMQQAGTAAHRLDDMDFGRRLAQEREIEKIKGGQAATANAVFDESGHFIIFPTLLGIKIVNIETNKVSRLLGRMENHRFMNIALYQGAPRKKAVLTHAMAASENVTLKEAETTDPTLFCTAFKRNRFFIFSKRDPDGEDNASAGQSRDIFNEKPSREEQTVATISNSNLKAALGSQCIIHTSFGDIHLRLFPEHAPKAVENFVGLAKKGYYDNVIFHRVISGFMIQTGDPLGDGTGGESLWGNDFEDEFSKTIKHDRPYTLSMANCGPNTNASQFFITTVPTPWLDNKHTVFGRVTGGMDVVHLIEKVRVDKNEKPIDSVSILGVEVR
ncbi:hypothetical protein HK101_011723 [Irineochytrium annulatum]|nr:hypothetical protein HK101_011723 [Irineochytrium annulatum]